MASVAASLDPHAALVLLPPAELLTEVQAVRQQHDKAFVRWPQAHLRLLWPFLPLRTALPRIEKLHEMFQAFSVELSEVGLLRGEARAPEDRAYVGVMPSDATRLSLLDLLERVLDAFPECRTADVQEPEFHVTLGQFPLREAERMVANHGVQLPLCWRCGALVLAARTGSEEPFRPVQSIPLKQAQAFHPPARHAQRPLPSLAWGSVIEALPLADAARTARLLGRQAITWKTDWWHELTENYFSANSTALSEQPELAFCSLASAAAAAASLRWAVAGHSKASPTFECRAVQDFASNPAVNHQCLSMPFQTATCMRHSKTRLLAAGEVSGKESGVAFWDLARLDEKPRFCKLRGQVQCIDAYEEALLVLGKGGSLSLHDISDPRAAPTSLGRKADGAALDVHWMAGGHRVLAAFARKVSMMDLEADGTKSHEIASLLLRPVVVPLDANHIAITAQSGCLIWDLRRSAAAVEVLWPAGFCCAALAKGGDWSRGLLAGGQDAQGSGPVHALDVRMLTTRAAMPGRDDLTAMQVFAGHPCFCARFNDGSLATWHADSHTLLGWWPKAQCLAQPSAADAAPWRGVAAAGGGKLRVAIPGAKGPPQRRSATNSSKASAPPAPAMPKAAAAGATKQGSKPRLRTSEDVYHRLLHDERFHPAKVVVGYEDRFLGPLEVKLPDFRPGGDIPFHRVYYFREEDVVLWDRRARSDHIFGSGEALSASDAAATQDIIRAAKETMRKIQQGIIKVRWSHASDREAKVEELPVMKYSSEEGAWVPFFGAAPPVPLQELRVLTFNVLFELFGDVETHMEARLEQIFLELACCQADIMALQEVTPSFASALLSQPWVQEQFWSTAGDEQMASVDPSGQLILSRLPMESAHLARVSPHKTVVLASIPMTLGVSRAATIANIHLSADARKNQQRQSRLSHRQEQLRLCEATLLERLEPADIALLVGDFNAAPEEEPPRFRTSFLDVWLEANPDSPGHTFDPSTNSVARRVATAVGGRLEPRRLDRIYVRSSGVSGAWRCRAQLACTRSFAVAGGPKGKGERPEEWFASDHFGVLCTLQPDVSDQRCSAAPGAVFVQSPESQLPAELLDALKLRGRSRLEVVLLGSAALGITDAGSDVDLLACSAELSGAQYFALAVEEVRGLEVRNLELAEDAAVPLLKFQAGEKEFEVQFASLSDEHLPLLRSSHAGGGDGAYEKLEALLFEPGARPQVGLSAALDAWALLRGIAAAGGEAAVETFRVLAREVKLWARQRQLLGTAFGFPGGFAWALLAALEVVDRFTQAAERGERLNFQADLLASFCARLARWEWPLSGAQLQQKAASSAAPAQAVRMTKELPVLWCPAGPKDRNALRSLTRGTAKILQAQLQSAALSGPGSAQSARDLPQFLILSVPEAAKGARSLLQRKALAILLEVERCAAAATVWPFTDVHTNTRGAPCIVLGCFGWEPTAGEQSALASSLRTSQGLELEARLIPASNLGDETISELPAKASKQERPGC